MAAVEIAPQRVVNYDMVGPGDRPIVVLIAGGGTPRRFWEPTVDGLSKEFGVLTFDNRDAGENEGEVGTYSLTDMADDVVDLLDALGIDQAHVIGHSLGGCIAQQIAVRHPERVDRLVLVDTTPAAGAALGTPNIPPAAEEWIEDPVERDRFLLPWMTAPGYYDTHPEQLREDADRAGGNSISREGLARHFGVGDTHDVRDVLKDITARTLVVHGELDPLIPLHPVDPPLTTFGCAELIGELIPDAQLLVYPGVGHLPMLEITEQFNHDVLAFLRN